VPFNESSDKSIIARLEAMSLEQARREFACGTFGAVGSPNHRVAFSWLAVKEAESRDSRESRLESMSRKALRNSNWANIIAIIAMILSAMAILVSWLIK
jgi:hypothetical protein